MEFSYTPIINSTAIFLIGFSPVGMSLVIGILLIPLHYLLMLKYRKKHIDVQFSWAMLAGSLILPFLFLFLLVQFHYLIDLVIGPHGGRIHGDLFMVVIFYPVITPVYLLIMWLLDRKIKHNLLIKEIRASNEN